MVAYMEILGIPLSTIVVVVAVLFTINIIGELLEFKGKAVPEFIKFRKYFARKKTERETLGRMPEMMDEVKTLLDDVNQHYSSDNIKMRDSWINTVNTKLDENETVIKEINMKLDKNSEDIVDLLVDNKRETIIAFAEKVADDNFPATREQFTRIDRIYQEYERIIEQRNLKNGEIEIAHKIIEEAYQVRLKNHTFIEDVRWHGLEQ